MADVVVVGGGICGLLSALLIARDGKEVVVLERDPDDVPSTIDEAWERWHRPGVAQFHQAHNFFPLFRKLLDAELPDVRDDLQAAGALWWSYVDFMPPTVEDRTPRPGDDDLRMITGRRATFEYVIARAAQREPRVTVRRGTKVAGLVRGPDAVAGVPHVIGVRTDDGETIAADLVVDASGRRAGMADRLADIGARPPIEDPDGWGFTYYTRYFTGDMPATIARPLQHIGTFSLVAIPADNDTWSITVFASSADRPLKQLRHTDRWMSVVRACPTHTHWLEGEPLTDVLPMSGVTNRCRRLEADGVPFVTGMAAVADACLSTNPSLGRGVSIGTKHAVRLRDVIRKSLGDPAELAGSWADVTEAELMPWYRIQVEMDRERHSEIELLRSGATPPEPSDPRAQIRRALATAMQHDADVYRAGIEILSCLATPDEVMSRPGMVDRIVAAAGGREAPRPQGPTRDELLALLA